MSDFLAGVGTLMLRDGSGNLVLSSDVLTESGVNISTTANELRGGLGNFLIGQYFSDGNMALTLTNATFDPQFIALNVGSEITIGTDVPYQETVTVGVGGTITVTNTPQAIGNLGIIGWYKLAGSDSWVSAPITFVNKTATIPELTQNTNVCVRYSITDSSAKELIIPGSIIPKIMHATLTIPKFSTTASSYTSEARSGEVVIEIPSFQLDGNVDLALSSTSTATVPLSGKALKSNVVAKPCDMFGEFGTLKDITFGKVWYTDLDSMAIASGADIQLTTGATETLQIVGIFGTATGIIANSNLTFTSVSDSIATVTNAGVVTGVGTGTTQIKVVVTGKTEIEAYASVTVS